MTIVDFTRNHTAAAAALALAAYHAEREAVPALPPVARTPELAAYAEGGLGVAAIDGGDLIGFLCCEPPVDNHFGATTARGAFSPIHAHAANGPDRARVFARLYQAAAEKWVSAGVASHSIALYAHDNAAVEQFFRYGFGMRCVDAIRLLHPLDAVDDGQAYRCEALALDDAARLAPLANKLLSHHGESPSFMVYPALGSLSEQAFLQRARRRGSRFFAASDGDDIVAYLEITDEGENFATLAADMPNLCGAYCMPAHRGGAMRALLSFAVDALRHEGYARLGVDFESFNPTAWGFWTKHFVPYTFGVVRRIDDFAVDGR